MDHEDLITELPQIEKLSNQERLRLAHKRRNLQLKKWVLYEKELGSKKNRMLQNERNRTKAKNPRIRFRSSIMLLEAAGRNDVEEVRKLLEAGVDPDVANEDGLTALHQCCIDDNEDMMRLLLDFGANVNAEDSEKWTPLHAAATCGHLHLVKYLIAKGANLLAVNAEGNMPYDICDEESTLDYIESEMAKRGVTQELIEEIRAFPETRMLEDMQKIIMEGGDLEYVDAEGATPLAIAAANGYYRVVEFLLDNHVATDVVDNDNWQPIHAAACWGHIDILELLVQNGADLNARTKNNETPYTICEDPEIKGRIVQLRSELETKMQDAARKKIRRSQSSNSRTQSIRRTSQKEKSLTSKKDVADEHQRFLAREINIEGSSPSPTNTETSDIPNGNGKKVDSSEEEGEEISHPAIYGKDSISQIQLGSKDMERLQAIAANNSSPLKMNNLNNAKKNEKQNKNNNLINKFHNPIAIPTDSNANVNLLNGNSKVENTITPVDASNFQVIGGNGGVGGPDTGNNTIDIHVQVTINTNTPASPSASIHNGTSGPGTPTHQPPSNVFTTPGTLSDLKKQRSLQYLTRGNPNSHTNILNSNNGLLQEVMLGGKYNAPESPTISMRKFTGDPGDIVGDYSDGGKKCCIIV